MTIEFTCKGCGNFTREPESEAARRKICMHCDARGIDLLQLRKVEKWEARDGSLHDSAEAAADYQLRTEIETALRAVDRDVQSQVRHLLSHFDVRRKGDPTGMVFPAWHSPVPKWLEPGNRMLTFYAIFAAGMAAGAGLFLFGSGP